MIPNFLLRHTTSGAGKRECYAPERLITEVILSLEETADHQTSLLNLADLLVKRFADWVQIDAVEGSLLATVAVSHRDLQERERARAECIGWRNANNIHEPAVGLFSDFSHTAVESIAISPSHGQFLKNLNLSSVMVLPLRARGKNLGYIWIGCLDRKFSNVDFEIGRDIGFHLGATVENWRLYREAQTAIQIRDEFLSIASHELRTPLTPLKIQAQQLLRILQKNSLESVPPEKVEKMLISANRQIDRLSKLIDDLLEISRISLGKLPLHLEEFDLMEIAADLPKRFSDQLQIAGCILLIEGPRELKVNWDLSRMEQVIISLLTNAMKYGPGKPIELLISETEGSVTLSMRDHGIGIDPADQDRIFKRFERAVSGTHFGGLGLGLYIASQTLSAHGGKFSVESALGQGSVFHASLPANARTHLNSLANELNLPPKHPANFSN